MYLPTLLTPLTPILLSPLYSLILPFLLLPLLPIFLPLYLHTLLSTLLTTLLYILAPVFLPTLVLAAPSQPQTPISICGTAGFSPPSHSPLTSALGIIGSHPDETPSFTSNFNTESWSLAGTAEKIDDAVCRRRPGGVTWVTLNAECRCRFYEDEECEVEWGGSGGSLGQGPVERLGGWEGARGYRCGWGYE